MRFAICAVLALLATSASAADDFIHASVATRMVEDGKIDNNRLFIFEFVYSSPDTLPNGQQTHGYCNVTLLTINNVSCDKSDAMSISSGPWTKVEFCTKDYCGPEFTCRATVGPNRRKELIVNYPFDFGGRMLHRIVTRGSNTVTEYQGSLQKIALGTNSVVTAAYRPIETKHGLYTDIPLGCSKISVPTQENWNAK